MIVRVLKVPQGGKDEDGREVGDDWLLADFGCTWDDDGKEYCIYLTTDRVQASRYADMDGLEPEALANWMADRINEEWQKDNATNVLRILDLSCAVCPTCAEGLLDCEGIGEKHHAVWCEKCGWEGKAKELMK
jgi:predicted RNA-binding Zn-ribbon protein involved in translation (DUF1610 family)